MANIVGYESPYASSCSKPWNTCYVQMLVAHAILDLENSHDNVRAKRKKLQLYKRSLKHNA